MEFFKRKVMYPGRGKLPDWKSIFSAYNKHLEKIKTKLPVDALKLAYLDFHDAEITRVVRSSKREVRIELKGLATNIKTGDLLTGEAFELVFKDAAMIWVPESVQGDIWLYEEMHLSDIAAFDYRVLFDKDEIRVQADKVFLNRLD